MTPLISIIIVLLGCVAGAYGAILLKKASHTFGFNIHGTLKNKNLIYGVLIYAIGTVTYIIALKGAELSLVYPIVSTTYIWTAIFSEKLIGEKMNRWKWTGIGIIIIGVILMGLGL
jgi:drug/metabolite transporter (DMT)-like permease